MRYEHSMSSKVRHVFPSYKHVDPCLIHISKRCNQMFHLKETLIRTIFNDRNMRSLSTKLETLKNLASVNKAKNTSVS